MSTDEPSREAREAAEVIAEFVRDHPDIARKMIERDGFAVVLDDVQLDRIGSGQHVPGEVERKLAGWRQSVHLHADRVLVDTDEAVSVINNARQRIDEINRRGRVRRWVARTLARLTRHGGKR